MQGKKLRRKKNWFLLTTLLEILCFIHFIAFLTWLVISKKIYFQKMLRCSVTQINENSHLLSKEKFTFNENFIENFSFSADKNLWLKWNYEMKNNKYFYGNTKLYNNMELYTVLGENVNEMLHENNNKVLNNVQSFYICWIRKWNKFNHEKWEQCSLHYISSNRNEII